MHNEQEKRREAAEYAKENGPLTQEDHYYPGYHIAPPVGLLNDPNGWIQWGGRFHLFYQWMPFSTGHGAKYWAHVTSDNLVDWQFEAPALVPGDWFDQNGCYSGSAISMNGQLYVFYTGNVKDVKGERHSYQCSAVSTDGVNFTKEGVRADVPSLFTQHFRDPKLWKANGKWYMVVGAQTKDLHGAVAWFESEDLDLWEYRNTLIEGLGYMCECPDFFTLNGQEVLLVSPQGLVPQGRDYNNQYQSGYIIGTLDYEFGEFSGGGFTEIDRGFEFYAPQTMNDELGRRILIGWMGMPGDEKYHPTQKHGWMHQLTLPRELIFEKGFLQQKPVEELTQLRQGEGKKQYVDGNVEFNVPFTAELYINSPGDKLAVSIFQYAKLTYSPAEKLLTLERPKLNGKGTETRSVEIPGGLDNIRIYLDYSSIEIFVNEGETVFSSRMFADPAVSACLIEGKAELTVWELEQGRMKFSI